MGLRIVVEEHEADLEPRELVGQVIDPAIKEWEDWFKEPGRGNGPLHALERDLVRSFAFFHIQRAARKDDG